MSNVKIGMVVVTYNRELKLSKLIESVKNQIIPPEFLLIVDNGSTDGTEKKIEQISKEKLPFRLICKRINNNVGSSLAFKTGMELASSENCDWFYVGDDDAYPSDDFFSIASQRILTIDKKVGVIAAKVTESNNIALLHRRNYRLTIKGFKEIPIAANNYKKDCFDFDLFSYVGIIIRKEIFNEVGYPNKDYFNQYEDTEFSIHVLKKYKIVCFPSLNVYHDIDVSLYTPLNWRTYYAHRNRLNLIISNFNFYIRFIEKFKYRLKTCTKRDPLLVKVRKNAYRDAVNNRLGKNEENTNMFK